MTQSEQYQSSANPSSLPQCCGTGCTVCVLDYPELFAAANAEEPGEDEAATLALLEAFERATQDEPQQ